MKIHTLSTGDPVYRRDKCVVIQFAHPRKVLSTSLYNGGYREDLAAVFNHDCNPGDGTCSLRASTYLEHMRLVAREIGLNPAAATGMATAASMENLAIRSESYRELTVTALATGGVEINGGRVGDPATHFKPGEEIAIENPGTINIMLVIDADLSSGTIARALVTCTEAKTAALQELMAGSNYSNGLATGSGTDQTIIVANGASPLYLENAGKHSKLGELIGVAVKHAVKQSLDLQTGLSPAMQHSVLRRLKRFGITEESLWQHYLSESPQPASPVPRQFFLESLQRLDRDSRLVTCTALYVHLLDQFLWQLLTLEEVQQAANDLLALSAANSCIAPPLITAPDLPAFLRACSTLLVRLAATDKSNS